MALPVGVNVGHFFRGVPADFAETVRRIEDLGFDGLWFAEAYGSDVFTPLAYAAAVTSRIRLGTAVAQIPARTPTATATTAATLDQLSGGRVVLGLGASGPQVSEGWHGVAYPRPLARTREYVDVVRRVLARAEPLDHDGEFHQLPLRGGTRLGKPLKSSLHILRPDLPIQLGAEGPRNVALAAEIADGWHAMFFSPAFDGFYREALDAGFARRGGRPERFEVVCTLPVVVDTDVERAADRVRPDLALYMGGMGARGANFHHDVFARMGHAELAARVQDLYLRGEKAAAAAAIPTSLVEEVALVGPPGKIREEIGRWESTVVGSLAVQGLPADLDTLATAVL
ncbi:Coenzyme F420-dependent oxidoreductase [Pseudonocardia sp. Ae717_Ps2]|nr:Coenzyme F420-dependent oxidoreductase [Pseudonocardia sp. Ae717_Ps2]